MNMGPRPANNSPSLLADPNEPSFVALANRLDAPDFGCALQVSGDGGKSWLPVVPVPHLPPGAQKCYAPEIAFDSSGALYYLFVGLAGPGNSPIGAFITKSTDRGRRFSSPRQVLGPERYQVRMAIDMGASGRDRVHLVWLQAGSDPPLGGLPDTPNPIMSAHSDDGANTFSAPKQVSDPSHRRAVAPALAVGPDNRVHVAYYDLLDDARDYQGLEGPVWDGKWMLVVATSTDGGERFRRGIVDTGLVPWERVMLIFTMPPPALVAGEGDDLYTAWPDARNGDADVLLRRSVDGGRSWGPVVRVNDDGVGTGRSQYLPHLSFSSSGRLDAVFYDRRSDPENVQNEVWFTSSTNRGTSFSSNVKLTRDSFSSLVGQQYAVPSAEGLVEFGSRLGLESQRSSALAAWTDTRNASAGRGTTEQDVFTTLVHGFPGVLHRQPALVVGGVVLCMGLLVLALSLMTARSQARAL